MTIHSEHDTHRHDSPHEASDARESQRQSSDSASSIALPVAALAALTAAVLWFGLSPAPPARPTATLTQSASARATSQPGGSPR